MIPKSGLEIKNRCIGGVVAVCRRNRSSSRQRRMESDADLVAATTAAGGPFSFAATKNRIGGGRLLPQRLLQAGHSPLRQRRIESDADIVAVTAVAGGLFSFAATKIRIGCGHRSRYGRCRRNHSSLPTTILSVILKSGPKIKNHCSPLAKTRATSTVIPKFTP